MNGRHAQAAVPASPQRFRYRARGPLGQPESGELEATDAASALKQLQERQLAVLALKPVHAEGAAPGAAVLPGRPLQRRARAQRIGLSDQAVLLEEFSTLLQAGVSLAEAAPSLAQAYAGMALGAPLAALAQALQGGQRPAQAFRHTGLGLPEYALSLVDAGDAAGRLGEALQAAAAQLAYEHGVRQQVRSALVYPAVLVSAGVVAVMIIFAVVVPRFAGLLASGRAEIPALSRWVLNTGMFVQQNLTATALAALTALGALALAWRTPALREAALATAARLPVVGPWLVATDTGRWATLLGGLLAHRVPMLQALELSATSLGLPVLRRHVQAAQSEVRRGRALSDVLAGQGWIPHTRINLVRVGERAGELPRMLSQLGQLQTELARTRLQRVLGLVEPLAIVLIGSVVGVIMVGVVLAITSLNTARF